MKSSLVKCAKIINKVADVRLHLIQLFSKSDLLKSGRFQITSKTIIIKKWSILVKFYRLLNKENGRFKVYSHTIIWKR